MPWRDFARNWLLNLTSTYRATFVGIEKEGEFAIFELNGRGQTGKEMRLDLDCGNHLTGRPEWQRIVDEERTRIGFFIHGLGLSVPNLEGLSQAPQSRLRLRYDTRLWAKLLPANERGALTENLSLGGCCVAGEFGEVGQEQVLRLELPFLPEPTDFPSRVVWSSADRVGVEFINLTVEQEQQLLRATGRPPSSASSFLPGKGSLKMENRFKIIEESEATVLFLSVPNWDFAFKFENATLKGRTEGQFERFYSLEFSEDLLRLKTKLGICLERKRNLVHIYLLDVEGTLVAEIWGDEVWHDRVRRA